MVLIGHKRTMVSIWILSKCLRPLVSFFIRLLWATIHKNALILSGPFHFQINFHREAWSWRCPRVSTSVAYADCIEKLPLVKRPHAINRITIHINTGRRIARHNHQSHEARSYRLFHIENAILYPAMLARRTPVQWLLLSRIIPQPSFMINALFFEDLSLHLI